MPEIQVEVLRRNDEKRSRIKKTLVALSSITGLPWIVNQHDKSTPYTYALDDAHVPLAQRNDWNAYKQLGIAINDAVNSDTLLTQRYKSRKDLFP